MESQIGTINKPAIIVAFSVEEEAEEVLAYLKKARNLPPPIAKLRDAIENYLKEKEETPPTVPSQDGGTLAS